MAIFKKVTAHRFYPDKESCSYFWVYGNDKNPPLLLIPGFGGTHQDLLEITSKLKDKYFLIILDMPGWGKSEPLKVELTLENYALYLNQLLDHLNIKRINILGHCMGAAVALEFCYLFGRKVEKVILVSTPFIDGTIFKEFFLYMANASLRSPRMIRPIFYLWRNRFFEALVNLFSLRFKSNQKKINWLLSIVLNRSKQTEDTVYENWTSFIHLKYSKFKDIKMPILIIHGSDDIIVTPKQAVRLHQLLPSSKLKFIKDGGHILPSETPQTLQRVTLEYLD